MGERESFFNRLPLLDKNKATKYIIYGLLGSKRTIMGIFSRSRE